jgi:hypothetical protein
MDKGGHHSIYRANRGKLIQPSQWQHCAYVLVCLTELAQKLTLFMDYLTQDSWWNTKFHVLYVWFCVLPQSDSGSFGKFFWQLEYPGYDHPQHELSPIISRKWVKVLQMVQPDRANQIKGFPASIIVDQNCNFSEQFQAHLFWHLTIALM